MRCMTLTVLCCLALGRYAAAVDKPPEQPTSQRSWLVENLCCDMTSTPDPFTKQDVGRIRAVSNPRPRASWGVGDHEVALLADYYYRTRARAEEDLQLQQLSSQNQEQRPDAQQAAVISEGLKRARADRQAIATLGGQLAGKGRAVQNLRRFIDASLPGFRSRENLVLTAPPSNPDPRYGSSDYVGPVYPVPYVPYTTTIFVDPDGRRRGRWPRNDPGWRGEPTFPRNWANARRSTMGPQCPEPKRKSAWNRRSNREPTAAGRVTDSDWKWEYSGTDWPASKPACSHASEQTQRKKWYGRRKTFADF